MVADRPDVARAGAASAEADGYFGAAILRHASTQPAAPAIFADGRVIDFAAVGRAVRAQADAFLASGVGCGTRVALAMRDRPAHIAALISLQRLGATAFLVAPSDPPATRLALIAQAAADVAAGSAEDAAGWPVPFVTIGEGGDPAADLPPPPGPEAVCVLRRSSGTTGGVPRLTPISHRFELAQFAMLWALVPRGPGDRYLAIVSSAFDFGRVTILRALSAGAAVILPPPLRTVDDLVSVARRLGATWTIVTPTHLRDLLGQPGPRPLLPGVGVLTTGAALTEAERVQVMEQISPELHIIYATNEAGLLAVASPDDLRRIPGTVGRPMAAIRLEIVDADGRAVPAGTVGEIRASHPAYATGYVPGAPGSSGRFAEGWFYPGDAGMLDADGYLFLKGRGDDAINVGGQKVYPIDIVERLMAHPAVGEAAAIGIPERRLGTAPVAAVVLREPVAEATLIAHCRERLGRDRAPVRILAVDALPRTPAAKVDRGALMRLLLQRLKA